MQNFKYKHSLGFTLVELLIAVAIIAILATIAYPSYTEQVRSSKRKDAVYSLTDIVNRMERYYSENNNYTVPLAGIGVSTTSPDGLYTLSLTTTALTYTATATPITSKPQSADSKCTSLSISQTGARTSTGGFHTAGNGIKCWR